MFKNFFGNSAKKLITNNDKAADDSFSILREAKNSTGESNENHSKKFSEVYSAGLLSFKKFVKTPEKEFPELKTAISKFSEASKIKKNHPGPYFYLAYIAYLNSDKNLAVKYIKITAVLDNNFPGLQYLQQKINSI